MQIKQLTNGHPIICITESPSAAEASLAAGAVDCILVCQKHELGACLEKHVTGTFEEPYFRKLQPAARKKTISNLEKRLHAFDRHMGALLRRLMTTAGTQGREIKRVLKLGGKALRERVSARYKELKVERLLRKQKKLVQPPPTGPDDVPSIPRFSAPTAASSSRSLNSIGNLHAEVKRKIRTEDARVEFSRSSSVGAEDESSEAMRTLELSFKTLFRTALDAMFLLDGSGSILHVNPAGCALLASAPAQLLGKSLFDFVPVMERERASEMWEALLIEGQQKTEFTLQPTAGATREVLLAGRANLWFGVHLMVVRDLTEMKKLQRQVATQVTTLQPGL
jgi:PAS domain S-box-containing protein